MVITGAEMHIRNEPRRPLRVALAPQEERELGVRFQSEHAVDHLRAGVLELLRPVDIGFFVEARHQLDDDGHFLATRGGLHERLHQRRIDAGAIDSLLDRDNIGIVRRAANELDDRLERLIRVVQQDVVLAHRREDVRLADEALRFSR